MTSLYIYFLIVCVIVVCESVPVDRTGIDYVRKNDKSAKLFDGFVSDTENNIVRSKRDVISGHLCPDGQGKLYVTGECVPCNGYVYITVSLPFKANTGYLLFLKHSFI